ncbi:hypothetical protein [Aliivibrio sifiae]|uniref:Anti-bacteriophage protein A/HamA C-terminal domain-containing protein n=1 Tax=Aliivibrio sifiae TaxID=566293 RepID=A0A2S7XHI2_9GAMM|nr:hypothetical protein [Aliivibrio sifiae]PQJ93126.1 hypothetical protein BTO23_03255 [Aliivibrio sifiae]GLR75962.1 hypothetical protein GCM10007855_28360 [Aliivibrio sifiae]
MSRENAIKVSVCDAESSGYHFKSSSDNTSFVITSKHGLCHKTDVCEQYQNNDTDSCKECNVELNIEEIEFTTYENNKLTPIKVYSFKNKDMVITSVEEVARNTIKIGKVADGDYTIYGYKKNNTAVSRVILDKAVIECGVCFFNIYSNSISELVEKSDSYYGISGSLVVKNSIAGECTAVSVITNNESDNDLSGELLFDIDFSILNDYFSCSVFRIPLMTSNIDEEFKSKFNLLSSVNINHKVKLNGLIPRNKGIPRFNLSSIVDSLFSNFDVVLGKSVVHRNLFLMSAINIIKNKRSLDPVSKLLSSKVVESFLHAPHIYSTCIEDSNYHHMHYSVSKTGEIEFLVSNFTGYGDISETINQTLGQIINDINTYSLNSSLITERAFLDKKYSEDECEDIYNILFGNVDKEIKSISIVHTISLDRLNITKDCNMNECINNIINLAADNIPKNYLDFLDYGITVNVFVIPVNKDNELYDLMEKLINEC